MSTPEIILTAALASIIAFMLVRPFVVRRPAAHPVRRRRPRPALRPEVYRLSRPTPSLRENRQPVRVLAAHRKLPPLHSYGHKKNSEAYSNS